MKKIYLTFARIDYEGIYERSMKAFSNRKLAGKYAHYLTQIRLGDQVVTQELILDEWTPDKATEKK